MGESKRRHSAIGQEIDTGLSQDGKPISRRYGGRFGEYINEYQRTQSTSPVPCNGCDACCYYSKIDFDPTKERIEDLEHLDMLLDPDREGFAVLRKQENGACIHLGPNGCEVYDHRPLPCRKYDCRIFSAIGMVDVIDDERRSPAWSFDILNTRDKMRELALRIAAAKFIAKHDDWTAGEAVKAAFLGFQEALPEAERLVLGKGGKL
jgi:Fe-S-cluster containining protein